MCYPGKSKEPQFYYLRNRNDRFHELLCSDLLNRLTSDDLGDIPNSELVKNGLVEIVHDAVIGPVLVWNPESLHTP